MSIGQHDNPHDTILPVTGRVLRAGYLVAGPASQLAVMTGALVHVAGRVVVDSRHDRSQRPAGLGRCSSPPVFGFGLGRCRGEPRVGLSETAASPDRLDRPVGSQQQRDQQDNYASEQQRHGHLPSRRHRILPKAQ
jgi:hypothetical protein